MLATKEKADEKALVVAVNHFSRNVKSTFFPSRLGTVFVLLCLILSNMQQMFLQTLFSAVSSTTNTGSSGKITREVQNACVIYPSPTETTKDLSNVPILIFLAGTSLRADDYESLFKPLASGGSLIVYVLDTNPHFPFKSSKKFKVAIRNVKNDILAYYNIDSISSDVYLGGHSVGGIIALNAFYRSNFAATILPGATMAITPIKEFDIKGFVLLDAADGNMGTSYFAPYGKSTKYRPDKNTSYVLGTAPARANPYPILMFASNVTNTLLDYEYGGQRAFKTLAVGNNDPYPKNKYCFVSASKYFHNDYIDPRAKIAPFGAAYRMGNYKTRNWDEDVQATFVRGFQEFIRIKISSFILSSRFNETGFEDVQLKVFA